MTTKPVEGVRPAPRRDGRRRLGVPRNLDDALALAGWAAYQSARGRLPAAEVRATQAMLKEFRLLLDARDLEAKVAELRALKAERDRPRCTA